MVQNFMHSRFAPAVGAAGVLAAIVSDLPEHRRGRQTAVPAGLPVPGANEAVM
jgi:hypothetical protein